MKKKGKWGLKPHSAFKVTKHTTILDYDRFGVYWIFTAHRMFNTYDWAMVKKTKDYIIWKNVYYDPDDPKCPTVRVRRKQVKKIIAFYKVKTNIREEYL